MMNGTLEQTIDQMVAGCGLDPTLELGARVKLAVCELYEAVPPGLEKYILVMVRHETTCATILWATRSPLSCPKSVNCDCQRTVEISFPDAGENVIVH